MIASTSVVMTTAKSVLAAPRSQSSVFISPVARRRRRRRRAASTSARESACGPADLGTRVERKKPKRHQETGIVDHDQSAAPNVGDGIARPES